ncbi:terpenoid synthase [Infundibulicybe gibba]|nr:terpenoid synthase [Infundibulicybe gibba]
MGFVITAPQFYSQTPSDHQPIENVANPDPNIYFRIPDLLRDWPWPRRINPHYSVCSMESTAWCEALGAFSPKSQDAFNSCAFSLSAGLSYPLLNKAGCRVGCDLINLYFIFDEYSDITNPSSVRQQADIIMDALNHPHTARPAGEWVGGEAARQFWENAIKTATPASQRQFKDAFKLYTDGVVQEAEDRAATTFGTLRAILILGATQLEYHALAHPAVRKLMSTCVDLTIIGNDIYSYNMEHATGGGGHNLVTAVMHEQASTLEAALAWLSRLNDGLIEIFLEEYKRVPTEWGSPTLNNQVAEYIYGIANWLRGNECWSYESERYFGKAGPEVRRTGVVKIMQPLATTSSID